MPLRSCIIQYYVCVCVCVSTQVSWNRKRYKNTVGIRLVTLLDKKWKKKPSRLPTEPIIHRRQAFHSFFFFTRVPLMIQTPTRHPRYVLYNNTFCAVHSPPPHVERVNYYYFFSSSRFVRVMPVKIVCQNILQHSPRHQHHRRRLL